MSCKMRTADSWLKNYKYSFTVTLVNYFTSDLTSENNLQRNLKKGARKKTIRFKKTTLSRSMSK